MADTYIPGQEFRSWTSLPNSSSGNKLLGSLAAGAIDAVGLKDFFDKLGEPEKPANTAPARAVPPAYKGGINPTQLPTAVPGGIGLNATPAGAVNPFQFQISPIQNKTPDDEHRQQIQSSWS